MTYEEILLLREKLTNDEISSEKAKELYFAEKQLSWQTKDWKERRDKIIKDIYSY